MQHVFIVGAKSLGAYGGYETFVYKLTQYHQNNHKVKYHIACKANGDGSMDERKLDGAVRLNDLEFEFHNAHCFKIPVPKIGSAAAIYYDIAALKYCCNYIKKHHCKHPIIYILACRIGPFAGYFQRKIHKLGGTIWLNPDGHEWKRRKWSAPVRRYWKWSEMRMVQHSDLIICDSRHIEQYIHRRYDKKGKRCKTIFLSYGAEIRKSKLPDDAPNYTKWLRSKDLRPKDYYLAVGRFVPENNYETMVREFMKSKSTHDFVLITNANEKFLGELEKKLEFRKDPRIKFVGAVYDQELLKKIRENAYGYFHGHEVGGTNPSLLEALGSTDLNLLLDVGFNQEAAKDNAMYWTKEPGNLTALIEKADEMSTGEIAVLGKKAKQRIAEAYHWQSIADQYEHVFLNFDRRYDG